MKSYSLIIVLLLLLAFVIMHVYFYDNIEKFGPRRTELVQVKSGTSTLYNWGLDNDKEDNVVVKERRKKRRCGRKKDKVCNVFCPEKKEEKCDNNKICRNCDITLNRNIDKYVLKSSVPPCPDMSKFAKKNMMCPSIDTSKYILRSEIPPCPKIDLSKYILKSSVPACPDCPKCPKCPICPVCPKIKDITSHPDYRKKCIFKYNITDHPDFKKKCKKELNILDKTDYKSSKSIRRRRRKRFSCNIRNSDSYSIGNGLRADLQSCSPYAFPQAGRVKNKK